MSWSLHSSEQLEFKPDVRIASDASNRREVGRTPRDADQGETVDHRWPLSGCLAEKRRRNWPFFVLNKADPMVRIHSAPPTSLSLRELLQVNGDKARLCGSIPLALGREKVTEMGLIREEPEIFPSGSPSVPLRLRFA